MSVVETKTCRHCSSSFDIMQEDIDFYAKISPRFPQSPRPAPITEDNDARGDLVPDTPLVQGGQGGADATTRGDYVAQIPTPTLCPDCRQCRRLAFRNERKLYRRKCDASQKDIISIYSPDKPYKVYDQKIRRSDARDPMDYGRDFDFSRTFMEQFGELMMEVPHCSILNIGSENSDYTNLAAYNKNSYLLVESSNNDSSLYGYWLQKSDHCVDCAMVNHSENCYQSLDIDDSYKLFFSQYCRSCSDSYLIENCTNCQFCFGCIGLDGKQYHVFNKPVDREVYETTVRTFLFGSEQEKQSLWQQRHTLEDSFGMYETIRSSDQVVTSHHVSDAAKIFCASEIHDAHNVSYSRHVWFNSGDCMDVDTVGYNSFLVYESINTALDATKNSFCIRCWTGCSSLLYSFNCDSSSHLFGCIGLRNKSYCIFNKQYTKEEYNALVPKIIEHMKQTGEWGEFFHPSLSPFGYNETVANEYYPVTGVQEYESTGLQTLGYKRSDYEAPQPSADKIIPAEKLPRDITQIPDDITNRILRCEVSGKPYRIIPQELAFYRKHNLPIPTKHPDVRHAERMALRK